jgi:ribonuclease HI
VYIEALETIKLWKARIRVPHIPEGEIKIRWVPSHSGIHGNELADCKAKIGAAVTYNESQQKHSLASLRRWQKMKIEAKEISGGKLRPLRGTPSSKLNLPLFYPKSFR